MMLAMSMLDRGNCSDQGTLYYIGLAKCISMGSSITPLVAVRAKLKGEIKGGTPENSITLTGQLEMRPIYSNPSKN